jgi:hypothetical protein
MTTHALQAENRTLGWAQLPSPPECPQKIFDRIIERRAFLLEHPSIRTQPRRATSVDADLRARARAAEVRIKNDEMRYIAEEGRKFGFKQVRTGEGDADLAFLPMTAEEHLEHLKRRCAEVGRDILQQRIEEERKHPTGTWDIKQRAFVPTIELLQKEYDKYAN